MTDLTPLIEAIIALAGVCITAYIIPWIKGHTNKQQREDLLFWVNIAVAASQQINHKLTGPERKQYVLNFLKEKGFNVDTAEVDAAIEAAVLNLHKELNA